MIRSVVSWVALSGTAAVSSRRTVVSWVALSGTTAAAVSGTGALVSARASIAGFQGAVSSGSGALAAQRSVLVASGSGAASGSGSLVARAATIFGGQAIVSAPPVGRIIVVHASTRVIEVQAMAA